MSSRKCPDCLCPINVCRELGGCGRPALAPKTVAPNYSACTNDVLRMLAKHGKTQRVRTDAAAELGKRGEAVDPMHDALITELARKHLSIETLETRRSDSLDFHEVSVWGIERALRAAYEAGRAAGASKRGAR